MPHRPQQQSHSTAARKLFESFPRVNTAKSSRALLYALLYLCIKVTLIDNTTEVTRTGPRPTIPSQKRRELHNTSVYLYAYSTHSSRSGAVCGGQAWRWRATPHLAIDELSHAFRGGVGTVGGPEGVVDVVVAQRGQLLAELLVVAL